MIITSLRSDHGLGSLPLSSSLRMSSRHCRSKRLPIGPFRADQKSNTTNDAVETATQQIKRAIRRKLIPLLDTSFKDQVKACFATLKIFLFKMRPGTGAEPKFSSLHKTKMRIASGQPVLRLVGIPFKICS